MPTQKRGCDKDDCFFLAVFSLGGPLSLLRGSGTETRRSSYLFKLIAFVGFAVVSGV